MLRIIVVAAFSLALVAPGRVDAQSITDSIGHQSPSLTQTAPQLGSSSHMSRGEKGALIGLGIGAGLGWFLSAGTCESGSGCPLQSAGLALSFGLLGAAVGAIVSSDRTAPGVPGLAPPRRLSGALTLRF